MNNRIRKIGSVSLLTLGLLIVLRTALAQDRSTSISASHEFRVCNTNGSYSQTIQAAIDAAQPGDVIKVAAGVYTETKAIGAFTNNLYISKTILLYGGYTCANWLTRDPAFNVTTIRPSSALISVVDIEGSIGQSDQFTQTLDGFTITGGQPGNHGGGIRSRDANALISNNVISGNASFLLGGGIWVQRGAPTIQNNRIQNNYVNGSGNGGGIELEDTQAKLINNVIANNFISSTYGFGGGIYVDGGGPVLLTSNTILSNAAAILTDTFPQSDVGYGGGVYVWNALVNLTDNTIQSNAANAVPAFGFGGAYGYGGGIYISNSPAFTLTGNTIISNTAGYKYYVYLSGGGVQIESSSGLLADNVIANNHANGNILFGNGGGLAVFTSTLSIQRGQTFNNVTAINCEGYGGGVYASNSSVTIDAARIENNCAANTPFYGLGGALAFFSSPYTITNAIIDNNRAYDNDASVGGLFAAANSPGLIVNNTFANNYGQGIRVGSALTAANNIIKAKIFTNTTGISLTAVVPFNVSFNNFYNYQTNAKGFSPDITNITINPQLDSSFHLNSNSPDIDAGSRSNAPDHDIDGDPRPMIGSSGLYRFDIGADEYRGPAQTSIDLYNRSADLTIIGPGGSDPVVNGSTDAIGSSVLGADVNGDGKDDLIVSAHDWAIDPDNPPFTPGRVFGLFNFGKRITGTIDLLTDTASLTVVSQLKLQHVGMKLISGDLNGDGKRDLIAGSSLDDGAGGGTVTPTVFVFWGGSTFFGTRILTNTFINTTSRPADFQVRAPGQDFFSFSMKNALASGDLNGDGKDDLIIGDGLAHDGSITGTGAAFVVFGRNTLSGTLDLSHASADYTLYGPALNADLGLMAVGHINAGSQLDLIARTDSTAYVILGPISSGSKHLISSTANITITGLQAGAVAVTDLTGDGQDDVILASNDKLFVIPGPLTNGDSFSAASRSILTLTNVSMSSFAVGNVIGDSRPDLIIEDAAHNRVYVLAGGTTMRGTVDITEAADELIQVPLVGGLFSDVSSGDLDHDGRPDLIIGSGLTVDSHPDKYKDAGEVFVLYSIMHRTYLPLLLKSY